METRPRPRGGHGRVRGLGSRSARSQVMELDKLGNFVMIVYIYLYMYTLKYEVTVNDEDSAYFQGTNPGIKSPKRGRWCIFSARDSP